MKQATYDMADRVLKELGYESLENEGRWCRISRRKTFGDYYLKVWGHDFHGEDAEDEKIYVTIQATDDDEASIGLIAGTEDESVLREVIARAEDFLTFLIGK